MNPTDSLHEFEKGKLPKTLNILTILTFIGCGLGLILTLATPVINKWLLEIMDKAANSGSEISPKDLAEMEKGRAAILLVQDNLMPLLVVGVIAVILCFIGALWMRKLKKDGYWLYVAGELLPIISGFALLGTAQFTGVMSYIISLGVPVLFIIMYTLQRKYLVN